MLVLATTTRTSGSTTSSRKAANSSRTEAAMEMRTGSVHKRSVRERVYGNESYSSRVSLFKRSHYCVNVCSFDTTKRDDIIQ